MVKLGRIARTISGVGFPHSFQGNGTGEIPFLKVSDLSLDENARGVREAKNWVGRSTLSELGGRVSPAGSVVFPKVGAALLKNQRKVLLCEAAMDNNLMSVVPRVGDATFLMYAMTTIDMGEFSGSGPLPYVGESQVKDLWVPFPKVEEQRRIAGFLDAEVSCIDRIMVNRTRQFDLLGERRRSRISSMVWDLGDKFGFVPLKYLSLGVEQGWSPQCEDRQAEDGEWGVLRSNCVNGGFFDWQQHKALPGNVEPRLEYQVHSGDLLVSRASGSVDLIGSAAVVPQINRKLLLCDKIYRISLNGSFSRAEFVSCVLTASHVRNLFKSRISGGEGMANNLPISVVKDAQIPKAPLGYQDSFLVAMREFRDYEKDISESLRHQIKLLEERKRALITAAVTGQIDVTTARGADLS